MNETIREYLTDNWLLIAGATLLVVSVVVGRRVLVVEGEIFYSTILYVGVQVAGWTAILTHLVTEVERSAESGSPEGSEHDEFVADDEKREREDAEIPVSARTRQSQ